MFGIKVAILSILVAGTVGWSNKGTPEGYPNCYVDYPEGVGDGHCSSFYPEHNVEACGWDGGDCDDLNSELWRKYPNCKGGVYPPDIGDGFCTDVFYPHYNTRECGWEGGDCTLIDDYDDVMKDAFGSIFGRSAGGTPSPFLAIATIYATGIFFIGL